MHLYSRHYLAVAGARLNPPDASIDDYRKLQHRLGTDRAVIVTPSTYGTNNQSILDGLAILGNSGRGIAVVDPSISMSHLEDLHNSGVRGARLNLSLGVTSSIDMLELLAEKIGHLGWHIQILMPSRQLVQNRQRLQALRVPLVFDHMGRIDPDHLSDNEAHKAILDLIVAGKAWVKLSGTYILSHRGPPSYSDMRELVRTYTQIGPDRLVWGSDWPHASATAGFQPIPDDAHLLDLIADWVNDDQILQQILVKNPANLYQF